MKPKERYMIISDVHVPDYDIKSFDLILKFLAHYKPDFLDILGDFVNFTKISKYDQDPYYKTDLADEIAEGRGLLKQLSQTAVKANENVQISYFEGNHEARMQKYLGKNAQQLAELTSDDEYIISVAHLFELKKHGIKWIPAHRIIQRHNVVFTHGINVRIKSGFAAHANIDKFGASGFTGHSHKLCHVTRTQSGNTKFWIETGCLCNLSPTPAYAIHPDWTQGFAVADYDFSTHQFYPQVIPIINHSFVYDGKLFS
jgi:predicted phosphodiesterase